MSARWAFLWRIEQQPPAKSSVLADLQESLWPVYRGEWPYDAGPGWYPMSLAQLKAHGDYEEIYQALLKWGDRWNLCRDGLGEWTLQTALDTLHYWSKWPSKTEPPRFCQPSAGGVGLLTDQEQSFTFKHPGWDPEDVSWTEFKTHITTKFEEDLDGYTTSAETLRPHARARG